MRSTAPDVLIVGAGVIGLTTAVVLADAGHRVAVKTAEPSAESTSAAAGALWGPWLVEPIDRVLPWADRTLHTLCELADLPETGVRIALGVEVSHVLHERCPRGLLYWMTAGRVAPTNFRVATGTASTTGRRSSTCRSTWRTSPSASCVPAASSPSNG